MCFLVFLCGSWLFFFFCFVCFFFLVFCVAEVIFRFPVLLVFNILWFPKLSSAQTILQLNHCLRLRLRRLHRRAGARDDVYYLFGQLGSTDFNWYQHFR